MLLTLVAKLISYVIRERVWCFARSMDDGNKTRRRIRHSSARKYKRELLQNHAANILRSIRKPINFLLMRAYFFQSFIPPLGIFSVGWLAERGISSLRLWCSRLERCFRRLTSSRGNNPKSMTTILRLFRGYTAVARSRKSHDKSNHDDAMLSPELRRSANKLRDPLLTNISEIITSRDSVLVFGP